MDIGKRFTWYMKSNTAEPIMLSRGKSPLTVKHVLEALRRRQGVYQLSGMRIFNEQFCVRLHPMSGESEWKTLVDP